MYAQVSLINIAIIGKVSTKKDKAEFITRMESDPSDFILIALYILLHICTLNIDKSVKDSDIIVLEINAQLTIPQF